MPSATDPKRCNNAVVGVWVNAPVAARIATESALLLDGRIIFRGTPEEMYASEEEYVQAFIA